MASHNEERTFNSWHQALKAEILTPEQTAVLQQMVDEGKAEDLARAAQLLDWQESVINAGERMYGF